MPAEITMPQLSDTMTEGTVVKWHKKEGDAVKAGEEIADVETDKAVMPMEAFEGGVLAYIAAAEGTKVPVGGVLAVIATGKESANDVKVKFTQSAGTPKPTEAVKATSNATAPALAASAGPTPAKPGALAKPAGLKTPATGAASLVTGIKHAAPVQSQPKPGGGKAADFDLIVIGGGPAGYAAAIRAGQLKKRVLCVEKEELGGTCLNWGCIPTKALLEDGAFIRKLNTNAEEHGVSFENLRIDFGKIVHRSRGIAGRLSKGVEHLFRKYSVKHESGTATVISSGRVQIDSGDAKREATATDIIIAVGARPVQLPGIEFDGKRIITSREAMAMPLQPNRLAIIGAGAIGCEFADFYNAVGTQVTVIEMLDHILPNEDTDTAAVVDRTFAKRGIDVRAKTKTEKVVVAGKSVKLTLSGAKPGEIEADVVLVAVGVTGNADGVASKGSGLTVERGRFPVDTHYMTNLAGVYAVGDCIMLDPSLGVRHPDLAHVAHHEAVHVVDTLYGQSTHRIDYSAIPGCTYTHPQVASMGLTEKKARDAGHEVRIGRFPFSASGRALAAGEPDGFVKIIFGAKHGEVLGVHMVGESVTELLSELVLARKLEATEEEILSAMHPHPTLSEAVMEAAGVAAGRAIHF